VTFPEKHRRREETRKNHEIKTIEEVVKTENEQIKFHIKNNFAVFSSLMSLFSAF
jgi:hypothetical protein